MHYVLRRFNRGVTNAELLADLRRVAQALGKRTVQSKEYDHSGRCCGATLAARFGSWNKALLAAGLEIESRRRITDEELFENLARVWHALGRQPVHAEMLRPLSAFSGEPYEHRFGGWRKALQAFVAWANARNTPGHTPTPPEPPRTPRTPSLSLRFAVLKQNHFKCQACGKSPATDPGVELHVDHIIPWSAGGPTTLDNLTTLCDQCNLGKGASVS